MKSILDKAFRYTPSGQTDLKKTFARIRREQAAQQSARTANEQEAAAKVKTMRRKG